MKSKTIFELLALAVVVLATGCNVSSNPYYAPTLLGNIPAGQGSNCNTLGAAGLFAGSSVTVSGASGTTSSNSYYCETFSAYNGFTVFSFQALLGNPSPNVQNFYAAIYDSSNNLVPGSAVTFLVQPTAGGNIAVWQTFDYSNSGIHLNAGSYTLFGYITTGTNVTLGYSTYSGGCLLAKGLTTSLSGFPSSINGISPTSSSSSLGLLVSSCP